MDNGLNSFLNGKTLDSGFPVQMTADLSQFLLSPADDESQDPQILSDTPKHSVGDSWLDRSEIKISEASRNQRERLRKLIHAPESPSLIAARLEKEGILAHLAGQISPHHGMSVGISSQLSAVLPSLLSIVGMIQGELEGNLTKLLGLNPSRREAVAQHLERLANLPAGPSSCAGTGDAAGGLRRWVDGPRTPAQNQALSAFFQEVAMVTLGQVILLKSWNDRGIRTLSEDDLGKLNWVLSHALKPHVPLDRDGWQITKPNLYSWYNPSLAIRSEIWKAIDAWRISTEGPTLLSSLLRLARKRLSSQQDTGAYDERFFQSLWEAAGTLTQNPLTDATTLKRKRFAFTPTLRDGVTVRTGPNDLCWCAMESHPFRLIAAELAQLWWGPSAPPIWAMGSGLEVHARDQLAFALGSPKPSLLTRIAEVEACEVAFVTEERTIRSASRTSEAARFREQLDHLPYFKKLRTQTTSLGALQACVALSKLRPGGSLWWAREEELGTAEGNEVLGYLLDHSRLVAEWRLDGIEHTLPGGNMPFPRFFYLFSREPELKARLENRPIRVIVRGQVKSHIEVPLLLNDAFGAAIQTLSGRAITQPARNGWQIHTQASPLPQKDWAERWPEATDSESLRLLEKIRSHSVPLAGVTTVRSTPSGDPSRDHVWSMHATAKGFWFKSELIDGKRALHVEVLPKAGVNEARGQGLMVLVPDDSWNAPLMEYLRSSIVREWLDHECERKGEQWILPEQIARYLPVPQGMIQALTQGSDESRRLPGEWESLAANLIYHPERVVPELAALVHDSAGTDIRHGLFVRAAHAVEHFRIQRDRLREMVRENGTIRWGSLLAILPRSELVQVTLHPQIRLSGTLPAHIAIHRMTRVKTPLPGILFATESGMNLHVSADSPRLTDLLWDQIEGLQHPTWSELVHHLVLPRGLELAESTANDILRSYAEIQAKLQSLQSIISSCLAL